MKQKYAEAFMDMAERFGQTSACERLKVGALLVKEGSIIAEGCNGTRSGFHTNCCEDENNRTKPEVRHAEIAALDKLRKSHNTSTGATLFVTHAPCKNCAIELVDSGIVSVYYRHQYRSDKGLQYLIDHNISIKKMEKLNDR